MDKASFYDSHHFLISIEDVILRQDYAIDIGRRAKFLKALCSKSANICYLCNLKLQQLNQS